MRKLLVTVMLVCSSIVVLSNNKTDSLLRVLDQVIEQQDEYRAQKLARISLLKQELRNIPAVSVQEQFNIYSRLFSEYESFIYDSAFYYASRMQEIAYDLGNRDLIALAKLKMSFVLLSSGMFHEAIDTLKSISPRRFLMERKVEYYGYLVRAYFDMADYANDPHFRPIYFDSAGKYVEKIMKIADDSYYQKWMFKALEMMRIENSDSARFYYEKVLHEFDLSTHMDAIVYSSLGQFYERKGDTARAIQNYTKSAIADIKSSTTETTALRDLASLLYSRERIPEAYRYIRMATADAQFYGARQRSFQISTILPIIEGEKLKITEEQKNLLESYVIALTILSAVILFFVAVILWQLIKLRKARKTILDKNAELTRLNENLEEANKIKEEYIGYYFNISTNYIDQLEFLKENLKRNLLNNRVDNVQAMIDKLNIKNEREQLFYNFDKIFLKLFPDFVEHFNSLFEQKDRIELEKEDTLNTDMRIFALIRMGITENEKIAKILNFSINTIYSYKNRIKKRSFVPNEEFEARIMEIESI
ncbi:MAG: DUF6377 domain-containing protein [Bacteroidales bacterium]